MNTDGKIVIEAKLETDKFETALQKLVNEAEKTGRKIDKSELEKAFVKLVDETEDKMQELEPLIERYSELLSEYLEMTNNAKGSLLYESDKKDAEKLKKQLEEIVQQIEEITGEKITIAGITDLQPKLPDIKNNLNDIGKSTKDIINKVVKWGFALFGVRTIYSFITSSMSTLSSYNQQLSADIQYIKFALATTLQPLIEAIIKLAYKLLTYTAYIAKAWFGVNLFANASTEAFEKTNKAVQGVNTSAKELKKTLTGFDEMNILQEDGSVSSGGGGGGVDIAVPSIDLSNWESVEIPKWLEWIGKNKDLILGFFSGIAGIITGIKIAELFTGIGSIFEILRNMSGLQIFAMIGGIATIGLGIYETIKNIIKYIQDPTWDNFLGIIKGLLIIVEGISIVLLALDFGSIVGWIGLVAGAIGLIVEKLIHEKKTADEAKQAEENLKKAREEVFNATNEYAQAVDNAEKAEKDLNDILEKNNISTEDLNKIIEIGTDDYQKLTKEQREAFKAYMSLEGAQKTLYNAGEKLAETKHNQTLKEIENQLALAKSSKEYGIYKQTIYDFLRNNKITTEEASKYMLKAFNSLDKEAQKTFVEDIPEDIKQALDTSKFGQAWNKFEAWWNWRMSLLDTKINLEIEGTGPYKIEATGPYKFGFAKGGIVKLASGAVINQPGRGVPISSAIGGERGMEGIIPLTDSQQMELLGEAIGRYITINANITNTMNGRVISRELQKVQNDSNFAFNR